MEAQEFVEDDILSQINLDDLPDFSDLLDTEVAPSTDSPPDEGFPNLSPASESSWIGEVENLLMTDDGDVSGAELESDNHFYNDFVLDFLVNSPSTSAEANGVPGCGNSVNTSPEGSGDDCLEKQVGAMITVQETEANCVVADVAASGSPISVGANSNVSFERSGGSGKAQEASYDDVVQDDDDPVSEKRRRQLRNKDAAVRSRERKKMYVKDLEVKSRYYEGECIRLGRLLQCFIAENQALRLSLQKSSAFDVSSTKQESAVLLLESLLLGSLLWFLGLVCLFNNLLTFPKSIKEPAPVENVVNDGPGSLVPRGAGSNLVVETCSKSRRCKASRTRMRLEFLRLVVSA